MVRFLIQEKSSLGKVKLMSKLVMVIGLSGVKSVCNHTSDNKIIGHTHSAGVRFVYHMYDYRPNQNYNKILKCDWLSPD